MVLKTPLKTNLGATQAMKIVFQFFQAKDGTRSPAMSLTRKELAEHLLGSPVDTVDDMYILVLHEYPEGAEDWRISQAPLMTVRYFCQCFSGNPNPFPEQPVSKFNYREWYGNFPPDDAGDNRRSEENE